MDIVASTSSVLSQSLTQDDVADPRLTATTATTSKKVPKRKSEVLEEDTYLEKLENIIQRDYFPDIVKLKAQNDYFDAVQNNDQAKIKQLQERFSSRRTDKPLNTPRSPAFFETPVLTEKDKEKDWDEHSQADKEPKTENLENKEQTNFNDEKQSESTEETVDKFLYKFTSEDNASFDEILDQSEEKMRQKYDWMFKAETEHDKKVEASLQYRHADEQMLAIMDSQSYSGANKKKFIRASVDNWTYKALNAVMFTPNGADFTPEEAVANHKMKQRQIIHENTRLLANVLSDCSSSTNQALLKAAAMQAAVLKGKVDPQGNEITLNNAFSKYSFVVTPSPAPGVNESPLMTWGEIEGTPFRLDAADTVIPRLPGPSFKIPDVPVRDELALKMTAELTKKNKEKKLAAMNDLRKLTPKFSSARSVERLDSMSPAAKRLATTKLGIRLGTDKSLKASYTPSPSRSASAKTPLVDYETPKIDIVTPAGKSASACPESLTDNLLNLSALKPKASDYF